MMEVAQKVYQNLSDEVVLFGAGKIGRKIAKLLRLEGKVVKFFFDNDRKKWGSVVNGIPVIEIV